MTEQQLAAWKRNDMVRIGNLGHGPVFRYLKPDDREPRLAWLEVPYTGRVFRFPALFLQR